MSWEVILVVNDFVVLFGWISIGYDIRRSPDVAPKVILVGSPILTIWSHTGISPHDVVKSTQCIPFVMSFKFEMEGLPFYYSLHSKYYAMTWGNLPVHKALENLHILYGLCLHIIFSNSLYYFQN